MSTQAQLDNLTAFINTIPGEPRSPADETAVDAAIRLLQPLVHPAHQPERAEPWVKDDEPGHTAPQAEHATGDSP